MQNAARRGSGRTDGGKKGLPLGTGVAYKPCDRPRRKLPGPLEWWAGQAAQGAPPPTTKPRAPAAAMQPWRQRHGQSAVEETLVLTRLGQAVIGRRIDRDWPITGGWERPSSWRGKDSDGLPLREGIRRHDGSDRMLRAQPHCASAKKGNTLLFEPNSVPLFIKLRNDAALTLRVSLVPGTLYVGRQRAC